MRAVLGIEVSMSDVIQAGLVELEKRYPPTGAEQAGEPPPQAKGKGRSTLRPPRPARSEKGKG
jgi:hypothetical protein